MGLLDLWIACLVIKGEGLGRIWTEIRWNISFATWSHTFLRFGCVECLEACHSLASTLLSVLAPASWWHNATLLSDSILKDWISVLSFSTKFVILPSLLMTSHLLKYFGEADTAFSYCSCTSKQSHCLSLFKIAIAASASEATQMIVS